MNQKQKEYIERRYREVFKPAYDEWIKLYPLTLEDLPGEVWVTVPEFADYHESNFGRTKRFYKNGNVKILKPCLGKRGYLTVQLCKDGKHKSFRVNRLVATLFIPNPDNKPEVNHLAGRFNNFVDCLEWATKAENIQHAYDSGLQVAAKGTDVYNAAVKDEADIIYIRENPDRLTQEQLADMFNCDQTTISNVQLGLAYANCGGTIREPKCKPLPEETKAEIRRLYVPYSREFGSYALARMFNCGKTTIRRIVNAQ